MPIELDNFVTRESVERAFRAGTRAKHAHMDTFAQQGMRAAKARDPKLLVALQKGAEVLQKMSEEQAGHSGYDVGGIRVQHTEFQLWKNAYTLCDTGASKEAREPYMWVYAMAGLIAGVVI